MTTTTRRTAVAVVVVAASGFLAACGGGPAHNGVASLTKGTSTTTQAGAVAGAGSSGSSGPTQAQLVKYAECVRAHGEPDFPDPVPAPGGGYAFRVEPGLNPRSPTPQFQAAENACQKDVPPSLENLTPAQMATNALRYSECMRSHGEPAFPEPNAQGLIEITNPTGIMGAGAPQFQRSEKACQSLDNGGFDEEIKR